MVLLPTREARLAGQKFGHVQHAGRESPDCRQQRAGCQQHYDLRLQNERMLAA